MSGLQSNDIVIDDDIVEDINLGSTGINEISIANVQVYPNPATSSISVLLSEIENAPVSVTLTTLSGQLLQSVGYNNAPETITVDVEVYPAGVYILQVTSEGRSTSVQVLKQ